MYYYNYHITVGDVKDFKTIPFVFKLTPVQPNLWREVITYQLLISITVQYFCSTKYPVLLNGQRQHGMRCLTITSTHDQTRIEHLTLGS